MSRGGVRGGFGSRGSIRGGFGGHGSSRGGFGSRGGHGGQDLRWQTLNNLSAATVNLTRYSTLHTFEIKFL